MTMKLKVLEDGSLVDSDGNLWGRLVEMEIEVTEAVRQATLLRSPQEIRDAVACPFCGAEVGKQCHRWRGGLRKMNHMERVVAALDKADTLSSADPGATGNSIGESSTNLEKENVEKKISELWAHYEVTFPSTRRELNEKRKRIIRNALRVRTVEECKLAITGLKHSPWHNGDNPVEKKYLDIRYALAGIGDESNDDRIDKMIEFAPANDSGQAQVAQIKVDRRVDLLRRYVKSGNTFEPTRARRAYAELVEWGFTIVRLTQHPWVEIARQA